MRNIEYAKKTLPSKLSSWDLIMNEKKQKNSPLRDKEKKHRRNMDEM